MKLRYLISTILIVVQIKSSSAASCRTSNDHKNYTCHGFQFRYFTRNRYTREQLLRVRVYDCKETHVPEEVLQYLNVQNLTLQCDIETIHENAFRNLHQLQQLDLGNNSISTLPNNMFQSQGELRTLNLSCNNFEELTKTMFDGLGNLKQLNLSHNKISKFELKTFDKLTKLQEIYLNNNQINFMPRLIFNKLRKLSFVDLSYNDIESLNEQFEPTYGLTFLNLSHNVIKNLPANSFQTTQIEILDLSYNKLTKINEDALKLNTLQKLYLQGNEISLFDIKGVGLTVIPLNLLDIQNNRLVFLEDNFIKIATNLRTIKISENPWDCDCFEKITMLRGELGVDVISDDDAGEKPTCVIGDTPGCNIDINNLSVYYNLFKEIQDIRK